MNKNLFKTISQRRNVELVIWTHAKKNLVYPLDLCKDLNEHIYVYGKNLGILIKIRIGRKMDFEI